MITVDCRVNHLIVINACYGVLSYEYFGLKSFFKYKTTSGIGIFISNYSTQITSIILLPVLFIEQASGCW